CAAIPATHVLSHPCTAVEEFVRVSLSSAASCPGIRHLLCQTSFVVTKHGKCLISRELFKMCATGRCRRAECSRAKRFGTVPNLARIRHEPLSGVTLRRGGSRPKLGVCRRSWPPTYRLFTVTTLASCLHRFSQIRQALQERTI